MRLIYLGYFIQIKIWLINSKFNKKKEKRNLKNSSENKNRTSNDNSNFTPYQCIDNSSTSGSKLKSKINQSYEKSSKNKWKRRK